MINQVPFTVKCRSAVNPDNPPKIVSSFILDNQLLAATVEELMILKTGDLAVLNKLPIAEAIFCMCACDSGYQVLLGCRGGNIMLVSLSGGKLGLSSKVSGFDRNTI